MTQVITPEVREAAAELLRRREALASLEKYRAYIAPSGLPDYEHPPAPHHMLMIRHLQMLEEGKIRRLLIMAPPASAKSTYCSIQYATWHLARNPRNTILCASNTAALAETFNRKRLNTCLSLEWRTLSGVELSPNEQAIGRFATTESGVVIAAGVSGAITGLRSDLNILDDPITGVEQAHSPGQLDKIWEWYLSDYRPRLKKDGKELIVTTRWAKRDIAGRIIERAKNGIEEWTILRLPMLADSADDPMGRALEQPLWSDGYSSDLIAQVQTDPLRWSTLYQQVPLDESGSWVGNENITYESEPPQGTTYVIAIDLALTQGRGDFTAMVVVGIDAIRKLHIVDVVRERISPDLSAERFLTLCDVWQPNEVLIEDDNASKVFLNLLHTVCRSGNRAPPPIKAMPSRGKDKETKASAYRGLLLSGAVRFVRAPWNSVVHQEHIEFPNGDHDDVIDALGLIGRRFPVLSGGEDEPEKPQDPYDGYGIRFDENGNSFTTKTFDELFEDYEDDRLSNRGRI